jgi:hypothetical protein
MTTATSLGTCFRGGVTKLFYIGTWNDLTGTAGEAKCDLTCRWCVPRWDYNGGTFENVTREQAERDRADRVREPAGVAG